MACNGSQHISGRNKAGRNDQAAGRSTGLRDGDAASARFPSPQGLAFPADGLLFVAGTGNHAIRHIELAPGEVATLAGGRIRAG